MDERHAGVQTYVRALIAVAAAGLLAAAAFALRDARGGALGPSSLALGAAFTLGFLLVQRLSVPFDWHGRRLTVSLDEGVMLLALVTLPGPLVPAAVALACAGVQWLARRPLLKASFNVSTYTTSALAAVAATAASLAAGLPPLLAAFPGVIAYSLVSNVLGAHLFARLDGGSTSRLLRDRFLLPSLIQIAIGLSIGTVMYGLWQQHPLVTLAVLPFILLATAYVHHTSHEDRKLDVHRRLAQTTRELAGSRDMDHVAQRVLAACGDIFHTGRATLALHDGSRWSLDFVGGPAPDLAALAVDVAGPDGGPIGTLSLHPSQRHRLRYGELEQELLRIVAGQAASAIANAAAVRQIASLQTLKARVLAHVPAGVLTLAGDGRILHANPWLLRTLGVPERAIGTTIRDVPALAQVPTLPERLERLLGGEALEGLEVGWPTEAGDLTLWVSGVPLPDEGGGSLGAIVLVSDITARRQAEEALRQQSVTRPLVRRIVLSLVESQDLTRFKVGEVGRRLASEIEGQDLESFLQAFRLMGLGRLALEAEDENGLRVSGDDLLERRRSNTQPTCHLAMGFLEGALGKVSGGHALGSEIQCQSQGHPRCVFVVRRRENPPRPQGLAPRQRGGAAFAAPSGFRVQPERVRRS